MNDFTIGKISQLNDSTSKEDILKKQTIVDSILNDIKKELESCNDAITVNKSFNPSSKTLEIKITAEKK